MVIGKFLQKLVNGQYFMRVSLLGLVKSFSDKVRCFNQSKGTLYGNFIINIYNLDRTLHRLSDW